MLPHQKYGTYQRPTHRSSRSVGAYGTGPNGRCLPLNADIDIDVDIEFPPGLPPTLESAIRSYSAALRTRMEAVKAEAAAAVYSARAKQRTAEDTARAIGRGMASLQREAVVMGQQLAELGGRVIEAMKEVKTTRAHAQETIRVANERAVYWEEVARGEAAEAVITARAETAAVKEEIKELKRKLRQARRKSELVRAGEEDQEILKTIEIGKEDIMTEDVFGVHGMGRRVELEDYDISEKPTVESFRVAEASRSKIKRNTQEEIEEGSGGEGSVEEENVEPCMGMEIENFCEEDNGADEELTDSPNIQFSEMVGMEVEENFSNIKREVLEITQVELEDIHERYTEEDIMTSCIVDSEEFPESSAYIKEGVMESDEIYNKSRPSSTEETPPRLSHIRQPTSPPPPKCLCHSITSTMADSPATSIPERFWPNGQVITYRFLDGHTTQHIKVTTTLPEWSRYANVTFRGAPPDTPALLAISFEDPWKCWGYLGTDTQYASSSDENPIALGGISISQYTTHGERIRILHQFGHVLGLGHEYMCPLDIPAGTQPHGSFTNYITPDLTSVMAFPIPNALDESPPTVDLDSALSSLDKAFMVLIYPRTRVHSQAYEWTLDYALRALGAEGRVFNAISGERNLMRRRKRFMDFLSSSRQAQPVSYPAIFPLS